MTLHPLASKGGAFVLKLGLVFKTKILSMIVSRIFVLYYSIFIIQYSLFTRQDFLMNNE